MLKHAIVLCLDKYNISAALICTCTKAEGYGSLRRTDLEEALQ